MSFSFFRAPMFKARRRRQRHGCTIVHESPCYDVCRYETQAINVKGNSGQTYKQHSKCIPSCYCCPVLVFVFLIFLVVVSINVIEVWNGARVTAFMSIISLWLITLGGGKKGGACWCLLYSIFSNTSSNQTTISTKCIAREARRQHHPRWNRPTAISA